MWKFTLLFILLLILIPTALVTLAVSFIYMDISLLNPANWDVGYRQLCAAYVGAVLFSAAAASIL